MADSSKISRDKLKAIIKECLIEILAEGLDVQRSRSLPIRQVQSESLKQNRQRVPQQRKFSPELDTPIGKMPHANSVLQEAARHSAGGDSVMQQLLEDTARKMDPSDLNAYPEVGTQASLAQKEQFKGNPEDVFGDETASNWAKLAFDIPSPKNNSH